MGSLGIVNPESVIHGLGRGCIARELGNIANTASSKDHPPQVFYLWFVEDLGREVHKRFPALQFSELGGQIGFDLVWSCGQVYSGRNVRHVLRTGQADSS